MQAIKKLTIPEYAEAVKGCSVKMVIGKECGSSATATMDMAEEAVSRLDEGFAFVGISEEWELSVCLFHKMFGGRCHSREFQDVRQGTESTNSTDYSIDGLNNWTDNVDGALYAHASEIFWRNIEAFNVTEESCNDCSSWNATDFVVRGFGKSQLAINVPILLLALFFIRIT